MVYISSRLNLIEYWRKSFKSIIKYTCVKLFNLIQFECKQNLFYNENDKIAHIVFRGFSSLQLYVISLNKFSGGRGETESQQSWEIHYRFSEQITHFLPKTWAVCSFAHIWWPTWVIWSRSLIPSERWKGSAQVAHQNWAIVSDSLRSLIKNMWPWAIRSGRSEEISECEQITQVAHQKNERFTQKTSERIPSPAINYTLLCLFKHLRLRKCRKWLQMKLNPHE